ncbi:MAG: hypothetical protein SFV81_22295 [Pirellulaceae bacterium]|nr:hypothetical protein [Pirellulaceae bacterium]
MSDLSPPINPYAPPTSGPPVTLRHANYLWREGDRLVIRLGAELPPYCMQTGGPAPYSHPISQIWQPKWVYLLLFFAVLPYFFLSPFIHHRIELTVPFGKIIYRKHQRWVNVGIVLMLTGGLLVFGFVAGTLGQWFSGPVALLLVGGVLMSLLGLQIASRHPIRLNIVKVENDLVFIDKVHPDYLARVPDILDTQS